MAIPAVHPPFKDGLAGLNAEDFVFVALKAEAKVLHGGTRAAVHALAVRERPLAGVSNAFNVFGLAGPFAVDDGAACGVEDGPEHEPVLAGRRVNPMVAGAIRYFRIANDVDLWVEQWEAASDGFGWDTVGAGEDFLPGLGLQLALHAGPTGPRVALGVEIEDWAALWVDLLDGDLFVAGDFAVCVFAREQLSVNLVEVFGAVEVVGHGRRPALDWGEGDKQLAVAVY